MRRHGLELLPFPSDDLRDPLRWPLWLRLSAIIVTSIANFVSNFAGAGLSVAIPVLMGQYGKSQSAATQVLTMNFLFLAIGNIFWVPLAMKFGKRAAMILSTTLLAGCLAWAAAAKTFNSLLAARSLIGFAAAAGESIVPEIVADTTFLHQRGAMMSIYVVLISGGSAVGPLVSGFMVTYTSDTWRSSVWLCCGLAIVTVILLLLLYPESNFIRTEPTPTELEATQKAVEISPDDEFVENTSPDGYTIRTPSIQEILPLVHYNSDVNFFVSLLEPLKLMIHPSVLWCVFLYGITLSSQVILIFTMSSLLMAPPYLFSSADVGMMQIAAIVGFLFACYGGGILSDVINGIIISRTPNHVIRPEQRLISLVPGMAIGPAGCILLAFACGHKLHWSAIAVGFGMVSFASVYTPNIAITYIVHRHERKAAKCLVPINLFKNLVAFLFLYVAVDWVNEGGYVQVYMIMFALSVVILACAWPLYYFDKRRQERS